MFERILRYVRGYVYVSIKGAELIRFLNLLNIRGILIWDIVRKDSEVYFFVALKDFFKVKDLLKKTKTTLRVKERYGLPFFLFSYRKRKMLFAGLLAGYLTVYIMSQYIWHIDFEGNIRYTDDELNKMLRENGIVTGMSKKDIDVVGIEKLLRNKYFDVTWASVFVEGTKLMVHIRENNSGFFEADEDRNTGDMISEKDCIISSIIVRNGEAKVKKGDVIERGDVIIEGKYEIKGDDLSVISEKNVRADGDVTGIVTYMVNESINRKYMKKIYTGRENNYSVCCVPEKRIDFSMPVIDSEFKLFDKIYTTRQLVLGESFYLPVFLYSVSEKEYKTKEALYSDQQLIEMGNEKLSHILKKLEENTIQILENNVRIEVDGDICKIYGEITALENVGAFGGVTHE